ncbi:MAG: nicotinate-nucleotide adenylyltransferase [Deltaproteobacteria bacterium]
MAGKRIGLFGGTFNPIHLGHLRGAEDIRESFGLDRVVFLPAAIPPHKLRDDVIEPRPRLEMVKLATLANPFFSVSDVEIERSGKSYSIDTLRYFRERQPDSFFFILGMDAFVEIETWKEYQKLFSLCNFIVMARPGSGKTPPSSRFRTSWVHRSISIKREGFGFMSQDTRSTLKRSPFSTSLRRGSGSWSRRGSP